MFEWMTSTYDRLVLRRPWITLALVTMLVAGMATQLHKITLDASADALLLQGDPSLELFREVGREYRTEEFVLVTWNPDAGLLSSASLDPLRNMADELRELEGVSSVVTVWDVPLLESPPVSLRDITSGDPLPSLEDEGVDRAQALAEFTTSPIYANLLVSEDGELTAVQINLERDDYYDELLQKRDALRNLDKAGTLSAAQAVELQTTEQLYNCLLYTSPSPRDRTRSRMPSSA